MCLFVCAFVCLFVVHRITVLCSAKQQSQGDKSPQSNFVRVYHDGTCVWWPLFEQSVSHCSIDVTWFPFDDQRCNLSFESWKYNNETLNITTKALEPDINYHYVSNEEWNMIGRPLRLLSLPQNDDNLNFKYKLHKYFYEY